MALLKRSAAGKLIRTASGKLATDCGAPPCSFCGSDATPANFTVTLDQTLTCPDWECTVPAGSYVAHRDGSSCRWFGDIGCYPFQSIRLTFGATWVVDVLAGIGLCAGTAYGEDNSRPCFTPTAFSGEMGSGQLFSGTITPGP